MMAVIPMKPLWSFLLLTSVLKYPEVRRDATVISDYHGTKIADPYRWLEDPDSKETIQFVQEQQQLTNDFLNKISQRSEIRERISSVWNYPKYGPPEKVGKRYYSFENSGLQNHSVMYVQDDLKGPKRIFVDPNKFSEDGTVSLDSYTFTEDGGLFSYALSASGSDWKTVHFKNVTSGEELSDKLVDTKWPSVEWSKDNKGVFYSRFPTPKNHSDDSQSSEVTENNKIYYHKIGTLQSEDILIAEFPESPKRTLYVQISECGEYLILGGSTVFNANTVHIASLKGGIDEKLKSRLVPIFPSETDAQYSYVTNEGTTFLFMTNKNSPNFRLITIDVKLSNDISAEDEKENTRSNSTNIFGQFSLLSTFLAEHPTNVLSWAAPVDGDKLLVCYLEDVKNTLELRDLRDGSIIHKFDLEPGSISGFTNEDKHDKEFFFSLQNFLSPGKIYRCDLSNGIQCEVFRQIVVAGTDLDAFITEQVFYPSKDGTKIPMYIVRKKDVPLDGKAPALLYGYGGFNSILLPRFSATNLVFVENFNGVYAMANIRGGGEYGEKWHENGSLQKKQNVFDDFQYAAKYLISNNYTNSRKLAIQGGSNGGLLVGACVNQAPELFGAAIAQVGVMDMLRFQNFTIGYAWCAEYGCSEDPAHFKNLLSYSPLHNIKMPEGEGVQYPAVLVTTADHDDRVVPAHSYKYAAELQYTIGRNPKQTNPLLLRIDTKSGHGAGKPVSKRIEETTDIYAFLAGTMDLTFTSTTVSKKSENGPQKKVVQ